MTAPASRPWGAEEAERFARLALECVRREYPNQIAHVLTSDGDVRPPRELTPAFFGCYDWHSAVHGHWTLARLARLFPSASFASDSRTALGTALDPVKIEAEVRYLAAEGREGFERPYGLAWVLTLGLELREWGEDDLEARAWGKALLQLERHAWERLMSWLPKLGHPIRTGEHAQSAFSMGLALDAARGMRDTAFAELLEERARAFHRSDRDAPIGYEPSGHDFLSPCLGEADLMRRVLPGPEFAAWLREFLPGIPEDGSADWLAPAVVSDPRDGKLAHLHGLNLSRGWMLEGIAAGLPKADRRGPALRTCAESHARAGLEAFRDPHYATAHWLGTFAVYYATGRGRNEGQR